MKICPLGYAGIRIERKNMATEIPPMKICPIIQIIRGNVFFTLVPITIHKSRIAPIPSTLIIKMHGLMIKYYVNDIQYILFINEF